MRLQLQVVTHPGDPRAVQLGLTDSGAETAERAIAIVHALQEDLTASIEGPGSQRTRDLVHTLETLLGSNDRVTTWHHQRP